MAKILIIEDDKNMQDILSELICANGHKCLTADDGIDGLEIVKNCPIDLIILDVMMPHLDGFSVCKSIRNICNVPIVFLTAKESEEDKLKGYEQGGDDYITKPFSLKVLMAKVNVLLRRSTFYHVDELHSGIITLITSTHKVYVSSQEIELTYKEFELLQFFLRNEGQVFSREQLINRIWGYEYEGNSRTVDSHIKTLRHKLGEIASQYIVTLIRSGYKFEVNE
ncbi:sensory transduction protein regX3 [Lachnospiraceae bacterium]|nr:sensory transduction protein regX3 [Lachnospiraceae bacterium]